MRFFKAFCDFLEFFDETFSKVYSCHAYFSNYLEKAFKGSVKAFLFGVKLSKVQK
jgi:hypothetical protein